MKIIWDRTPKRRERFDGCMISKTGVIYRDPVELIKSPEVQRKLKAIAEFREAQK